MSHKHYVQEYAIKVCIALLLILPLSMGSWSATPSFAHTTKSQANVVILNDPIATFTATDAEEGGIGFLTFTVKGMVKYTLDTSGPVPQITNIYQDIDVINGNTPNLPFSFTVRTSVDIENADGTYVKTITGQAGICMSGPNDICFSRQDSSSTPTNTSYTPGSSGNFGQVLFILKHNVFITTDNGGSLNTSPPYTYNVVCC